MLQKGRERRELERKRIKSPIGGVAKYLTMQAPSGGLAGIKGLRANYARPIEEFRPNVRVVRHPGVTAPRMDIAPDDGFTSAAASAI